MAAGSGFIRQGKAIRRLAGILGFFIFLGLCACFDSSQSQTPLSEWTTGFWFWGGGLLEVPPVAEPLDAIFFRAGTLQNNSSRYAAAPWSAYGAMPDQLPSAREYWAVFRYERQSVPDPQAAPVLAQQVARLCVAGRQRHLNVVGVQLDIDSPTGALGQYAAFLRSVKRSLPPGMEVSITALLDWFRDGTAIGDVVEEVDEFVPQFYDLSDPDSYRGGSAIAAKVDASQWAPRFNRFKKRFRIGLSTFGRASFVPAKGQAQPDFPRILYRDLIPLDLALSPVFALRARRNEAQEWVLTYRATRYAQMDLNRFEKGDAVEFILPTVETVRSAVAEAKKMRGYSAGILFFRWPVSDESLVLQPMEVLIAAGEIDKGQRRSARLHPIDGRCAAVSCMDLYLLIADPLTPKPVRYRIHSSVELEYFLPAEGMPIRMSGADQLEMTVPPYCGRGRMYLGRVVSAKRADFSVEEER